MRIDIRINFNAADAAVLIELIRLVVEVATSLQ